MSTNTPLTGMGPVSFTDSLMSQVSVPLEAFTLSGSKVSFSSSPDWSSIFGSTDQAVLLALMQSRLATGEVFGLPTPPPVPALAITASSSSTYGNNIVVTANLNTPPANKPFPTSPADTNATLNISATQTDTFANLGSVSQAATAIGVDNTSGTVKNLPQAQGLIQVVNDNTLDVASTDLPVPTAEPPSPPAVAPYQVNKGAKVAVLGPGGETLFNIEPQVDLLASAEVIAVNVTVVGKTVTLTAQYNGSVSSIGYPELAELAANAPDVSVLIGSITSPPGGYVLLPTTSQTVNLSGGGTVPATGIAYS